MRTLLFSKCKFDLSVELPTTGQTWDISNKVRFLSLVKRRGLGEAWLQINEDTSKAGGPVLLCNLSCNTSIRHSCKKRGDDTLGACEFSMLFECAKPQTVAMTAKDGVGAFWQLRDAKMQVEIDDEIKVINHRRLRVILRAADKVPGRVCGGVSHFLSERNSQKCMKKCHRFVESIRKERTKSPSPKQKTAKKSRRSSGIALTKFASSYCEPDFSRTTGGPAPDPFFSTNPTLSLSVHKRRPTHSTPRPRTGTSRAVRMATSAWEKPKRSRKNAVEYPSLPLTESSGSRATNRTHVSAPDNGDDAITFSTRTRDRKAKGKVAAAFDGVIETRRRMRKVKTPMEEAISKGSFAREAFTEGSKAVAAYAQTNRKRTYSEMFSDETADLRTPVKGIGRIGRSQQRGAQTERLKRKLAARQKKRQRTDICVSGTPLIRSYLDRAKAQSAGRSRHSEQRVRVKKTENGVTNYRNGCYMNAVLVAMLSLPEFVEDLTRCYLADSKSKLTASIESPFRALLKVVCMERLKRAADAMSGHGTVTDLKPFRKALFKYGLAMCGQLRQQDAHEFVSALLNAMDKLCCDALKEEYQWTKVNETAEVDSDSTAKGVADFESGGDVCQSDSSESKKDADSDADFTEPNLELALSSSTSSDGDSIKLKSVTNENDDNDEKEEKCKSVAGVGDEMMVETRGQYVSEDDSDEDDVPLSKLPVDVLSLNQMAAETTHTGSAQVNDEGKEDSSEAVFLRAPQLLAPFASNVNALSPVHLNFHSQVRVTLECERCSVSRSRLEDFLDYSLEIPEDTGMRPVSELLKSFFKTRTLEYKCEKCGHGKVKRSAEMVKLPRVLLIHVKRFAVNMSTLTLKKRHTKVQMRNSLDVARFCCDEITEPKSTVESIAKDVSEACDQKCLKIVPCVDLQMRFLEDHSPQPTLTPTAAAMDDDKKDGSVDLGAFAEKSPPRTSSKSSKAEAPDVEMQDSSAVTDRSEGQLSESRLDSISKTDVALADDMAADSHKEVIDSSDATADSKAMKIVLNGEGMDGAMDSATDSLPPEMLFGENWFEDVECDLENIRETAEKPKTAVDKTEAEIHQCKVLWQHYLQRKKDMKKENVEPGTGRRNLDQEFEEDGFDLLDSSMAAPMGATREVVIEDKKVKYSLKATVHHLGMTPNSGHYVCDTDYDPFDVYSFVRHDDEFTWKQKKPPRRANLYKFPATTCYLLFYVFDKKSSCLDD